MATKQPAARQQRSASSEFVTVACKLPQGLRIGLPDGSEVKLHGTASPYALMGHGMTQVKAVDWATIEAVYSEAKWLTSEAVFAMKNPGDASAKADERKKVDAGFDPIDPSNPNAGLGLGVKISVDGAEDKPGVN